MRPQPLIAVTNVEASSRWYQRLLGCRSAHGGTEYERLVRLSHLNPAHHYPRVFIEALANTNDARLRLLAALAFLYAGVRFIEAYWVMADENLGGMACDCFRSDLPAR